MSEHTPGPWVALASQTRFPWSTFREPPIFDDGLWHIVPADNPERNPIASVDYANDHSPEFRAQAEPTARLIASAPLMRLALGRIVAAGCWVPVPEGGTCCAFCNAVNDQAHDADCVFVEAVNAVAEADGTL